MQYFSHFCPNLALNFSSDEAKWYLCDGMQCVYVQKTTVNYNLAANGRIQGGRSWDRFTNYRFDTPTSLWHQACQHGGVTLQVEYLWMCKDTSTGAQLGVKHLQEMTRDLRLVRSSDDL